MFEYMENLTPSQAVDVKKTIQDLLRQTCILQVKYDPVTLVARDNNRYSICSKHREFIADYLSVLGCELIHDPQENIFRISGDGVVTERLGLISTKILLLLKIIYRDKILGEGLNSTVTTLSEIRKYGTDTNLINTKLTFPQWSEALSIFKRHQIIELPAAIDNLEDDSPIYIYSTINIFCPKSDINAIVNEYATLENGQNSFNNIEGDTYKTEEITNEATKENFY